MDCGTFGNSSLASEQRRGDTEYKTNIKISNSLYCRRLFTKSVFRCVRAYSCVMDTPKPHIAHCHLWPSVYIWHPTIWGESLRDLSSDFIRSKPQNEMTGKMNGSCYVGDGETSAAEEGSQEVQRGSSVRALAEIWDVWLGRIHMLIPVICFVFTHQLIRSKITWGWGLALLFCMCVCMCK